jgi:hypothetical protein
LDDRAAKRGAGQGGESIARAAARDREEGGHQTMARARSGLAQPGLTPVKAIYCSPYPSKTADAPDGCFCDDGHGYVVKPNSKQNGAASHCEWLSAKLGQAVAVPIPPFNKVEHTSGELWFGSQHVVGEIKDWWILCLQGKIKLSDLSDDISRIHAFDLFVHNIDRHLTNYIVTPTVGGHRIYAVDHARAWLFNGFPPPALPLAVHSKTAQAQAWMKQRLGLRLSPNVMLTVIDRLRNIREPQVREILRQQPPNWLVKTKGYAKIKWWKDGVAMRRLDYIAKGIGDGSLL